MNDFVDVVNIHDVSLINSAIDNKISYESSEIIFSMQSLSNYVKFA